MRRMKNWAVALSVAAMAAAGFGAEKYEANWESLNTRPCPQWWKDAKFGVFIHWGVYSVPAFAPTSPSNNVYECYAEHYGNPSRWAKPGSTTDYHAKHHAGKSYSDFAADFTAEHFEPAKWADLIRRSGAKYVVLTSKHHDGFALWPSRYSPYFNAGLMGPKRDLCGDLMSAMKAAGLRMGFYYSLLEWRHPLYNAANIDRFVEEVNLPQLKELVTAYRPDIVWTDGEWGYEWPTWRGPEFLAWLYNESPVRDEVVANDRWGKGFRGKCGDHFTTEYGGMEGKKGVEELLARHPWEECRGIGHSFGYNRFEDVGDYLSNEACVESLVEKCSRGGNLLLNIGPDATGLIPVVMQERLLAIGRWLDVNGEAVYGTTAWAKRPADMKKTRVYFTAKGDAVYAIVFGSPEKVSVKGIGAVSGVKLVGSNAFVAWRKDGDDVEIDLPAFRQGAAPCEHALVFRLKTGAPEPIRCREVAAVEGQAPSLLPPGEFKLVWHDEFEGSQLDTSKWGYRTNFWGQRAHWFAAPEDNAVEVKDGKVFLKLVKRPDGQFVSPQLQTGELLWDYPWIKNEKGFWPLAKRQPPKFLHRYGYYECRCKLQRMPDWWSAFWMQSETQGVCLDPARAGVEHDILEAFKPGEVIPHCFHANGYGADYRGFQTPQRRDPKKGNVDSANAMPVDNDKFHVLGMLWEPDGYTCFVDGVQDGEKRGVATGDPVSQVPEFILISTEAHYFRQNHMTGKAAPGLEAAAAANDAFVVDYVRVYDLKD